MPRYIPLLSDGSETRSIYEWKKMAKSDGFIFEKIDKKYPEEFRIINFNIPGPGKEMKRLKRITRYVAKF